jgi:hypothetical protein
LDAGRALVDAAGFGLVADVAGGAGKVIGGAARLAKASAEKAQEAAREAMEKRYQDALQKCDEYDAFLPGAVFGSDLASVKDLVKKLFDILWNINVGSEFPDVAQEYKRFLPDVFGKITAGIALLRTMPGVDVKEIDKMQLKLQGEQKRNASGKGRYAELLSVFETVSFAGGEKLIRKNIKSVLAAYGKISTVSLFSKVTYAQGDKLLESALLKMDVGLDTLSKTPGHDEKAFAELTTNVQDAHAKSTSIKGTNKYIDAIVVEGDEKTITKGIATLFSILSEAKRQASREGGNVGYLQSLGSASATKGIATLFSLPSEAKRQTSREGGDVDYLQSLGSTSAEYIEKGIRGLKDSGLDAAKVDAYKIKLQSAIGDIAAYGQNDPAIKSSALVDAVSFDGGQKLIQTSLAILFKSFSRLSAIKDKGQKKEIASAIFEKLDIGLDAARKSGLLPEKVTKLEEKISKTKAKGQKILSYVGPTASAAVSPITSDSANVASFTEPSSELIAEATNLVNEQFAKAGKEVGTTANDIKNQTADLLKQSFGKMGSMGGIGFGFGKKKDGDSDKPDDPKNKGLGGLFKK